MYGLVNKAVHEMVVKNFGLGKWLSIKKRAELDVEEFVCMQAYPDEITFAMVGAASAEFGMPPETVLRTLGNYWITYADKEGYGDLMELAGDSVVEVLENLEELHTRVGLSFPELKMPHFRVSNKTNHQFNLHYESTREGLGAFVCGIVEGLGTKFSQDLEIAWIQKKVEGAEHDLFQITLQESGE